MEIEIEVDVQETVFEIIVENPISPTTIGNLSDLDTIGKSNLVAAINEVNGKIGNLVSGDYLAIAGTDLSSGRVVAIKSGFAVYFDPNDVTMYGLVTGITKTSSLSGQSISIKLNGAFYESGLGLTPDRIYYAGLNGTITLNPFGLKLIQPIGSALSENTLNININSPIETI